MVAAVAVLALVVACLALYRCAQLWVYCAAVDDRLRQEFDIPVAEREVDHEVQKLTQQLQENYRRLSRH